jgi:hypothetical protein
MTTTWDLLNDAADIIERGGHTKGTLRDQRGHCAIGALQAAAARRTTLVAWAAARRTTLVAWWPVHWSARQPPPALERAYQALARSLLGLSDVPSCEYVCVTAIPFWNDQPERTAAEVVARLRHRGPRLKRLAPATRSLRRRNRS